MDKMPLGDFLFGKKALQKAAGTSAAAPAAAATDYNSPAMKQMRETAQAQADEALKPKTPVIPPGHRQVKNPESHAAKLQHD